MTLENKFGIVDAAELVGQADTSPEISAALIRATVEIFSRFADGQYVHEKNEPST